MVGAMSLDLFDFDLDLDMDVDASMLQVGFVPLRWLNLGSVPTMLWASIFAFVAWVLSRLINSPEPHVTFDWVADSQALIRDFGLATFITKCATQPLRGRFDPVEPNKASDLIGQSCTVSTAEVTDSFGEAIYSTAASPLRLTVRIYEDKLAKGDEATIVGFDSQDHFYIVQRTDTSS